MNPGSPYWLINPANPASPIWIARHAARRNAAGTNQPLSPEEDFIIACILSGILIVGLAFFGYSIYKLWKEEREQK